MKRKRAETVQKRDQFVLKEMKSLKSEHPYWGYRRIWAYLKYQKNFLISRNRVYRIMKENELLVPKNKSLKAKRRSHRPKPRASRTNEFWGIDMTKVFIQGSGWTYVHVIIDWFTKEALACHISQSSQTKDWAICLNKAVNYSFPEGIDLQKNPPSLISDNGCQPTSKAFMQCCYALGMRQIFTSWNNPKGNADTERFFRTMKEDCVWLRDWTDFIVFEKELMRWIEKYNTNFPHQSLDYRTPKTFKVEHSKKLTYFSLA